MRGKARIAGGLIGLSLTAVAFVLLPQRAASRLPAITTPAAQSAPEEAVPAFHSEIPKGPLPETMSPSLFTDVVVQNAYAIAAKAKKALYQQPCYCHCDRSQGHGSLLDCFASKHAAGCTICIREGFYAYEQTRKGKTGAQIREGIEHGEWQQVDITKYQTPLPVGAAK